MSTMIEAKTGGGRGVVFGAYALMLFMLAAFTVWSWLDFFRHRRRKS